MQDDISGWNDWLKAFSQWSDAPISEVQGIATAIVSICEAPTKTQWQQILANLSFNPLEEEALTLLVEETEDVAYQLHDIEENYKYLPLLPDDTHTLYERTMALKFWANGYIMGLGITDIPLNKEDTEVISNLSKIAAIRMPADKEHDEEGEGQLLELLEFARMVPVSMATGRQYKAVEDLAIIRGMPVDTPVVNHPDSAS